jgi:hypothetical protein
MRHCLLVKTIARITFALAGVLLVHALCEEARCQSTTTPANQPESEFVFPLDAQHNHAPGIVEFANGDLLVSWYRGSGERKADDVAVLGSWKRKGSTQWSEPFVMADQPDFPDCNTCMHLDKEGRLWLFWPTIIANSWESCLTRYRMATPADLKTTGAPNWSSEGLVLLKPDDFGAEAEAVFTKLLQERVPQPVPAGLHSIWPKNVCATNSSNAWDGNHAASPPYCRQVEFYYLYIRIHFRYRLWRSAMMAAGVGMRVNRSTV